MPPEKEAAPQPAAAPEKAAAKPDAKPAPKPEPAVPFVSRAQEIGDKLDELDTSDLEFGNPEENADEGGEESQEESTEESNDTDASESEESEEESESSDEKAEGPNKKDGFKKGLQKVKDQRDEAKEKLLLMEKENQLLKEKMAAIEERFTQMDAQKDDKSSEEEPAKKEIVYTDKQLAQAISQFIADNDPQGIMDVINYKVEQSQKNLRKEYEAEKRRAAEVVQKRNVEWQTITKNYSPEGYDNDLIKSDVDFDIRDNTSMLYKAAEKIYLTGVQKGNRRYLIEGGMSNAVQDAFVQLLQSKFGQKKSDKAPKKGDNPETEGLKQRLGKEIQKNSLKSGASSTDEPAKGTQKPKTDTDELKEYLSERSRAKQERIGTPIM